MIAFMKSDQLEDFEAAMARRELSWDEDTKAQWVQIQLGLEPKRFKEVLALAVATRRKELGLSQRELSEIAGINQRDISHIEQAKSNPTLSTQVKLLSSLGLTMQILSK
jgi:DNA-binding XRE family transcriptional regulator